MLVGGNGLRSLVGVLVDRCLLAEKRPITEVVASASSQLLSSCDLSGRIADLEACRLRLYIRDAQNIAHVACTIGLSLSAVSRASTPSHDHPRRGHMAALRAVGRLPEAFLCH
jgi:hypothetical protein